MAIFIFVMRIWNLTELNSGGTTVSPGFSNIGISKLDVEGKFHYCRYLLFHSVYWGNARNYWEFLRDFTVKIRIVITQCNTSLKCKGFHNDLLRFIIVFIFRCPLCLSISIEHLKGRPCLVTFFSNSGTGTQCCTKLKERSLLQHIIAQLPLIAFKQWPKVVTGRHCCAIISD